MANRYWVWWNGTWDTSDTTHWSATSGGAGGASVPTISDSAYLNNVGSVVTLWDNISCGYIEQSQWTLDANNFNITVVAVYFLSTVLMWNWTFEIQLDGWFWEFAVDPSATITCGNSTVKFTWEWESFFYGASKTYNNVTFEFSAPSSWYVYWSNTINALTFSNPGSFLLFKTGSTQTIWTFTASWTAGNEITINTDWTTAVHNLVKSWGWTIPCDYLNIQHSVATPSNTWYAGENSTNNQSVSTAGSGWIFTAPPAPWWTNSGFFNFM